VVCTIAWGPFVGDRVRWAAEAVPDNDADLARARFEILGLDAALRTLRTAVD